VDVITDEELCWLIDKFNFPMPKSLQEPIWWITFNSNMESYENVRDMSKEAAQTVVDGWILEHM